MTDVVQVAATDGDSSLNNYNVIQYSIKGKKLRRSYMSAHVLLRELGKRDKMQGLLSILSPFCNEFNKFNKTSTNVRFYLSYEIKITLKSHF